MYLLTFPYCKKYTGCIPRHIWGSLWDGTGLSKLLWCVWSRKGDLWRSSPSIGTLFICWSCDKRVHAAPPPCDNELDTFRKRMDGMCESIKNSSPLLIFPSNVLLNLLFICIVHMAHNIKCTADTSRHCQFLGFGLVILIRMLQQLCHHPKITVVIV